MNGLRAFVLLALVIISGCVAPHVVTNNIAFYEDSYSPKGSIAVVSADSSVNGSLEFAAYKKKFENKLSMVGYRIELDPSNADYIALVAYGIDSGETSAVSTPIFGKTSGGATRSSGTVYGASGSVSYSSSSYTMPTYGVVGSSTKSVTTYNRAVAIDIVEARSFEAGMPKKVYEGRTKSKGSCSIIAEVFDEMLDAMFSDFPGENGRNRRKEVPGEFSC